MIVFFMVNKMVFQMHGCSRGNEEKKGIAAGSSIHSKIFCNISAGGVRISKNLQALFMDAKWLIYRSLTHSVIVGGMYSMPLKVPDIFSRQYRVPRT